MENWKPVVGYEGYYEVSDLGRVRSVDGIRKSGIRFNDHIMHKGRILKQNLKKSGYYTVDLSKDNVIKTISVHRIVAMAFLPKPVGCDVVNHINCNKKDNRVCNLEWCTAEYNRKHAKDNNRYYSTRKKAVRCKQTQMEFESSYKAAEWLNETVFKNTRQVSNMACKIRSACLGYQHTAYGYTWENC